MPDLFEKKEATSFGKVFAEEVASSSLTNLHANDPFSAHYANPCKTSRDLVRYLIACQVKRFGEHFAQPEKVMERHAKLLAGKYTIEAIARGVCHASNVSNHPFSFAFVERVIPEIERRCPFLMISISTKRKTGSRSTTK